MHRTRNGWLVTPMWIKRDECKQWTLTILGSRTDRAACSNRSWQFSIGTQLDVRCQPLVRALQRVRGLQRVRATAALLSTHA